MKPADVYPQMVVKSTSRVPVLRSEHLLNPRVVRLTGQVVRHGSRLVDSHVVIDQVIRPGVDVSRGQRKHPPVDVYEVEPVGNWSQQLRAYADRLRCELSAVEKALTEAVALEREVGA